MAQETVAASLLPGGSTSMTMSLTAEEKQEIQEYENLLRFRDTVLSGSHPRIKPPQLAAKAKDSATSQAPTNSAVTPASQTDESTPSAGSGDNRQVIASSQTYQANHVGPPLHTAPSMPGLSLLPGAATGTNGFAATDPSKPPRPEIDPVLLGKSDNLIRAEMHLLRQRLERGLRDQVDQKRASHRASLQAPESLTDLDIADVLSKALALSQTTVAPSTDDAVANASASSDSFDDNTFYSSQHDTPEPNPPPPPRSPAELEDDEMRDGSPYEPQLDPEPVPQRVAVEAPLQIQAQAQAQAPSTQTYEAAAQQQQAVLNMSNFLHVPPSQNASIIVPGLSSSTINRLTGSGPEAPVPVEAATLTGRGKTSRQAETSSSAKEPTAFSGNVRLPDQGTSNQSLSREESTLIRSHDLSPIAPQPAHVSPLAVSRQAAVVQQEANGHRATPAQVVALRNEASGASSPDSSPQGNKATEKKKNKKKKRKAERLAAEAAAAPDSPRIKTEPHSPSPVTAVPYSRPNKRQRQSLRQQAGPNDDESRYDQSITVDDGHEERYEPRNFRDERVSGGYERADGFGLSRPGPDSGNTAPRNQLGYYDDRGPPAGVFQTQTAPLHTYPPPPPQSSEEVRTVRAVSHAFPEPPYREALPVYRDPRGSSRMSMRPNGGGRDRSRSPVMYDRPPAAIMPPPRVQPTRIVVDEFGREYIEPPRHAAIMREAALPGARIGEQPEVVYERPLPPPPPPHSAPRRAEMFEEDRVVYQSSPAFAVPPRRVVTQPEFPAPDYRPYRERDYAVRQVGPPGDDYVPVRVHTEGRDINGTPREHVARAASVRPLSEAARYDVIGGYERRLVEERPRDHMLARSASVRPAEPFRYEIPIGYERRVVDVNDPAREFTSVRSASVRPPEIIRYSEAPVSREYGTRLGSVRPEMQAREYAGVHPDARRELRPPLDVRPPSVRPLDAPPPVVHDYWGRPPDHHGRPPPVHAEQEMVYVERVPAETYR